MSTQSRVTLICDLCGRDDSRTRVAGHTLSVDGKSVAVEACERCWPSTKLEKLMAAGDRLTATGRRIMKGSRT